MAPKRNPNDRNLVAEEKRKAAKTGRFELSTGITVITKPIDYVYISAIGNSVELPEKPTYTVRTSRGREEQYPLDDKVVEQSPEFKEVWQKWKIDMGTALQQQGRLTTRAMFLDGTEPEDPNWYDEKWERRMKQIGFKLPDDPTDLWLLYLETGINSVEAAELTMAIMRLTTLPEEAIQAAEETFRDMVRPDQGSGDVEESGADPQGVASGAVA